MHCEHSNTQQTLKLSIFDSVHLLNHDHWNGLVDNQNVYLSIPYLQSLETSLKDSVDFRYILFYNDVFQPVGIAIVQLLRITNKELNADDILCRFGGYISEKVLNNLDARVLLCGNAFSTGENGYIFCKSVSNEIAKANLSRALDRIKRDEKKAKNGVSIILLKDFWPSSFDELKPLELEDYSPFMIDVNMVIKIRNNWKTFDDYMGDLVTKFRTKVKGIYKKSQEIEQRILSSEEIRKYSDKIKVLYQNVLDHADYRFGHLMPETFEIFADKLDEYFRFSGYFYQNEMVGFSTCFKTGSVIDANFVGIDYELNHDKAIYQRMLSDFIQSAIECNATELRLGRTAEEMKSTLGAEPVQMKLLVKHKNTITNKLVRPIVNQIGPSAFEQRKPFKAVLYQS